MDRPRVGVAILGASQELAVSRYSVNVGQRQQGTLKNLVLQADADFRQVLRAVERRRLCGVASEPVANGVNPNGKVEHVGQQFLHAVAGAAADQGQRQHLLVTLSDPLVEQHILVVGGEREVQGFRQLVFLPMDELPTVTFLDGQMRNWLDFHQRKERLAATGWETFMSKF